MLPSRWPGQTTWLAASLVITLIVVAPIAALGLQATRGSAELWPHLRAYVLLPAIGDTLVLLLGVAAIATAIGTVTAWIVTAYDFRGRHTVDWALLLPLAVPTYIVAYAYLDVLHPVGMVQTMIRTALGYDSPRQFRLPDVRSMVGCATMLGLVLYPYVYLATRAMFLMQSANLLDVARTLGLDRRGVFVRVALPLARPAIVVGLMLTLLETVNDIGASEFLGIRTLTVAVYTTWVTRSDLPGAAQIALAMLGVVLVLVLVERAARRHRRYANDAQHPRPLTPHRLTGSRGAAALAVCLVPILLGFVVPAVYLAATAWERVHRSGVSSAIVSATAYTVVLSAIATVLTLAAGIAVAYAVRVSRGAAASALARVASIGYAVPGTVLGIGLLPVITGFEGLVDAVAQRVVDASTGLFLLGSGGAVVLAYTIRFLALASGGVESGLSRVPTALDDAARTLGERTLGRLWRIHLPLARPALATAALLVFVDCMKELPATLLLRPLGVETLSTLLYGEAVRGTYEEAAIVALLIVIAGLVPVIVLARVSRTPAGADTLV